MRLYILIFLCHLAGNTSAQYMDTGYFKLIYSNIRHIQDSGIVFYSDKPEKEIYAGFLKQMPYATKALKDRVITLSKREEDTLMRELKRIATEIQPSAMFPMSTRISSDSIIAVVEKSIRRAVDSLKNLPYNAFSSRNYQRLPWAFFFTNPIYLRNRTICFGYFMYYRNSSGEHGLNVYIVQNGEFIRVGTIGGGAW